MLGDEIRKEETFEFEEKESVPATPVVQIVELPRPSTPTTRKGVEKTVKPREKFQIWICSNHLPHPAWRQKDTQHPETQS